MRNNLLILAMFVGATLAAQEISLQPQPQQFKQGATTIALPGAYTLTGEHQANPRAVAKLHRLMGVPQEGQPFRIFIGERGDKSVKAFVRHIPKQAEGYYLKVDKQQIVIAGNDERGTYYALQTLAQLIDQQTVPQAEITDYPAIARRGVVEGFYGTPWSHEARLSQLRFYGENKMNTYIYGPKDDPYHSAPNWRLPYPEAEAKQLTELITVAKENEVDFVWAIHPGQDIVWNEEDRNRLVAKFESMYQLGVRSFALFFDDISGEGTRADRQAELLNYLDNHFVKTKPDVTPLVMCPTEYNKSWSNPAKGYLTTLGKTLNPSIHVMWTGDRVVADITQEGVAWINERICRPAYIWWNFPVSDYVRDHLLLGAVYGNDTHIASQMSGFVTNPMEHAESSKIAIYGVAAYAWNPEKYNPQHSWKKIIAQLLPHDADALQTFANHNSGLTTNGHRYSREESVEILPTATRFGADYAAGSYAAADFDALNEEFIRIEEAADILFVSSGNASLIREITPWLHQFKLLGETGQQVLTLAAAQAAGNQTQFLRTYRHLKALQQRSFWVDQTQNQNISRPGVKTGSIVLKPLIDATFTTAVTRYNSQWGTQLDATTHFSPHQLASNIEQLKSLPLQVKTNRIFITPLLEVVRWPANGFVAITLEKPRMGRTIDIDLGVKEVAAWATLEVSADGITWNPIAFTQKENRITATLKDTVIQAVRLSNTGDKEMEVYLRRFMVTVSN